MIKQNSNNNMHGTTILAVRKKNDIVIAGNAPGGAGFTAGTYLGYIILENVRNLASHDNGNTWKTIKENINELNYYTYDSPLILHTLHFGDPQSRERAVILCVRNDIGRDLFLFCTLYGLI